MSALPCVVSRDIANHERDMAREEAFEALVSECVDKARSELLKDKDAFFEVLGNFYPHEEQSLFVKVLAYMQEHDDFMAGYGSYDEVKSRANDIASLIAGIFIFQAGRKAKIIGLSRANDIKLASLKY